MKGAHQLLTWQADEQAGAPTCPLQGARLANQTKGKKMKEKLHLKLPWFTFFCVSFFFLSEWQISLQCWSLYVIHNNNNNMIISPFAFCSTCYCSGSLKCYSRNTQRNRSVNFHKCWQFLPIIFPPLFLQWEHELAVQLLPLHQRMCHNRWLVNSKLTKSLKRNISWWSYNLNNM